MHRFILFTGRVISEPQTRSLDCLAVKRNSFTYLSSLLFIFMQKNKCWSAGQTSLSNLEGNQTLQALDPVLQIPHVWLTTTLWVRPVVSHRGLRHTCTSASGESFLAEECKYGGIPGGGDSLSRSGEPFRLARSDVTGTRCHRERQNTAGGRGRIRLRKDLLILPTNCQRLA